MFRTQSIFAVTCFNCSEVACERKRRVLFHCWCKAVENCMLYFPSIPSIRSICVLCITQYLLVLLPPPPSPTIRSSWNTALLRIGKTHVPICCIFVWNIVCGFPDIPLLEIFQFALFEVHISGNLSSRKSPCSKIMLCIVFNFALSEFESCF